MREVFELSEEDLLAERAMLTTKVTTLKASLLTGGRPEAIKGQLNSALLRLEEVSEEERFRSTNVVVGDYVEVEVVVKSVMFRVRRMVKARVVEVENGLARVVGFLPDGRQVRVDLDRKTTFTKLPQ